MKKWVVTVWVCLAYLFSANAQNSFKPGEMIKVGDVPGFVFYVDETGEHGLAMSMPAGHPECWGYEPPKGKKDLEAFRAAHPELYVSISALADAKLLSKKTRPGLYAELVPRLGADGQSNQENIKAYCLEKGYDFALNFPWEYWAENLGEGWFSPGENELELFAKFYCGGTGKKNHVSPFKWDKLYKERSGGEPAVEKALRSIAFGSLISSSATDPEQGFTALYAWRGPAAIFYFFYGYVTNLNVEHCGTAAVYRF